MHSYVFRSDESFHVISLNTLNNSSRLTYTASGFYMVYINLFLQEIYIIIHRFSFLTPLKPPYNRL